MIPAHLHTTWQLLQRAFPSGVDDGEYLPLLAILYPHMADENLAIVISEYTGRDVGVVLNDILAAGGSMNMASERAELVKQRLRGAGFDEWVADEP
jgi:hypothetical protein